MQEVEQCEPRLARETSAGGETATRGGEDEELGGSLGRRFEDGCRRVSTGCSEESGKVRCSKGLVR